MEKHKTVLFVSSYRALYGGNFVASLRELEKHLQAMGYNCIYIFPTECNKYEWFQILSTRSTTVTLDSFDSKLGLLLDLNKLTKEYDVGLIHTHFLQISVAELYSALNSKIRVFIHIHSDFSCGKESIKTKVLELIKFRILSRHVTFISVNQKYVKLNNENVKWIPNAIARERFVPSIEDKEKARIRLNISNDTILCEIFGWSPYVKGLDIAVNAVKSAYEQCSNIVLGIVYGREMGEDSIKEWINSHTNCSGDEPFLRYLKPREDVFTYHYASDFLISASRSEGFSYAILEMLSIGKPCIVSNIPGVAWSLKYRSVYPFETESIEDCKKKILSLISGNDRIFPTVCEQIHDEYGIDRWAKSIIAAYGI